jgi:PAS domain S-box-containing protein
MGVAACRLLHQSNPVSDRRFRLSNHLFALVTVVALPLLILSGLAVWHMDRSEQNVKETALLSQAQARADLVDRTLEKFQAALATLAASAALHQGDLDGFEMEMRGFSGRFGNATIRLSSVGGYQILSTRWRPGERLHGMPAPATAKQALASGRAATSGLTANPETGAPEIAIATPVVPRDGMARLVVSAEFPPSWLANDTAPAKGWIATVLDPDLVIVARTQLEAESLGSRTGAAMRAQLTAQPDGFIRDARMPDGQPAFLAYARAPVSGYTVLLGQADEAFRADPRRQLLNLVVPGMCLVVLGLLAAWQVAAHIVTPLRRLRDQTAAPVRSEVLEIDELAQALWQASRERERADTSLGYQLRLLRTVTESTSEVIFLADERGRISYLNPAAERMLGWSQDEVLGQPLHHIVPIRYLDGKPVPDWDSWLATFQAKRERPSYQEATLTCRDGSAIEVEFAEAPVIVDEKVSGAVLTARDLRPRRQADSAMRDNERRLRELVGTLDLAAVMVRKPTGEIEFWSNGCERMYGWTVAEAVGQRAQELLRTVFPIPLPEIEATLGHHGEWSGDLMHTTKDGRVITVATRKMLTHGPDDQPLAVMESLVDVTAWRVAQLELRQLNHGLEARVAEEISEREAAQIRAARAERMQALGQLAGGIAHDFNNVLQAISGGAALIERRPGDAETVGRLVHLIIDAANRGASITHRMLAFARRGELRAQVLQPAEVLDGMREICAYTLGTPIEVRLHSEPGLPAMLADRAQLETALVNLATNARDAMPDGGTLTLAARLDKVTAAADNPASLSAGRYIRIDVTDTGTGMSPAVLGHIGEPFFTTKGVGKGTGLGISMVKGFTEQSGGGFAISSEPGHGTVATIWIPVIPEGSAAVARGGAPDPARHPVGRIILVDDDPLVRVALAEQLSTEGHDVVSASGGEEALVLLRSDPSVDMLITDLAMPGISGLAVIQETQALRPGLPMILLTGYAGDVASMATGGGLSELYSLIRKPVSQAQLIDKVAALMEAASHADAGGAAA